MQHSRRILLQSGLGFGASLFAGQALANAPERRLSVLNLHTGERLQATFWAAGGYVQGALGELARVLRDHRTGEVHAIAPELLDVAATLATRLSGNPTVEIISGYRSPQTNQALRKASTGVATRSLHMEGKALDLRIPGVDLARLRDAAWALQRGGVGFYPESNFVHVDVGRVRRW